MLQLSQRRAMRRFLTGRQIHLKSRNAWLKVGAAVLGERRLDLNRAVFCKTRLWLSRVPTRHPSVVSTTIWGWTSAKGCAVFGSSRLSRPGGRCLWILRA